MDVYKKCLRKSSPATFVDNKAEELNELAS